MKHYIPHKAKLLTYTQIKKAIKELKEGKEDTIYKITIIVMYFCLLRGTGVMNIKWNEL